MEAKRPWRTKTILSQNKFYKAVLFIWVFYLFGGILMMLFCFVLSWLNSGLWF
jgi:hypothetical protein